MAVTETLAQLHLTPDSVALGEAHVAENLSPQQMKQVAESLQRMGFELVADRQSQLIADVKQTIIELVRGGDNAMTTS